MAPSFETLFRPRAIAVLGASRDPDAIGHQVVQALIRGGFRNPIYPINPKATDVAGLPAFPSLGAVPGPIDLAVIAVPASVVPRVIDPCIEKGVGSVVVITAGFAETSPEGADAQNRLVEKLRAHGIRMVGPNCFGVMNTSQSMNASFSPNFPPAGNISMASQSGGLGLALLDYAKLFHLGLNQFVSLGNKADVSSNDLVEYWENDKDTKVILLYLESLGNPDHFLQIARRVTQKKPILVLKGGRSSAGTRAASSHTAALAESDSTFDALLHQARVLRVETMEQLFHLGQGLSLQNTPTGRRVAIVTNAGGPGILCTDACESFGLKVNEPSDTLKQVLARTLPPEVKPANPLDLVASAGPEHFARAIPVLLESEDLDALIVIYTVIGKKMTTPILHAISQGIETARKRNITKPVLLCWITDDASVSPLHVQQEIIPAYRFPEDAARTLSQMAMRSDWIRQQPGSLVGMPNLPASNLEKLRSLLEKAKPGWLPPEQVSQALELAGLPWIPTRFAHTAEEAATQADALGFPVAVKIASETLSHKTDIGGVCLNVKDATAVRSTFLSLEQKLKRLDPKARPSVQIQPMSPPGVEIFVGMQRDPAFGPVLAFGLGGIYVEALADIRFRVLPVTDLDLREMIQETKAHKILSGLRGKPASDIAALEDLLQKTAWLAGEFPQIASLDFNPVMAYPKGCSVVDARIEIAKK